MVWVLFSVFSIFFITLFGDRTITKNVACSRLSISGSERKQRRAKNQAIQGERAGARGLWEGAILPSQPSSFFPRSPAACRTDPLLTEGLEQATKTEEDISHARFRHVYYSIVGLGSNPVKNEKKITSQRYVLVLGYAGH